MTTQNPPDAQALVKLKGVKFHWPRQHELTLDLPELSMNNEERLFIRGPSGCGKSTLLGILAGINLPQQGQVTILGQNLGKLSSAQRDKFRADHIGYLFQQFNLLPYLSVLDNVMLSCRYSNKRYAQATEHGSLANEAARLLQELGLGQQIIHKPVTELSIGQQQRVAAARALIGKPELIIADEPTSALDADNRDAFIELLLAECQNRQQGLIFVSHDQGLGKYFNRQIDLSAVNRVAQAKEAQPC